MLEGNAVHSTLHLPRVPMNAVQKYLAEIGQRGDKAGRGASKARTHEQAVAAGRAGGIAAAKKRKKK